MKTFINRFLLGIFLLFAAAFSACEKSESEEPVGLEIVYIPQSTVSNGTNLNYLVPSGFGNARNFKVTDDKVNVLLGITKSGKADAEAFTVDVSTRTDTLTQLIAGGATFELLPSGSYTLPQQVSFASGQSVVNFNLSIDKTVLKTYAGKKVAVCVVISNLTNSKYTLSPKNRQVIVIVDVDALKLT